MLTWQTALEQKNTEFQIEHSLNGIRFNKLGIVAAHNNAGGGSYIFVDEQPHAGQ
jgi:hypothetical protein